MQVSIAAEMSKNAIVCVCVFIVKNINEIPITSSIAFLIIALFVGRGLR